MKNVLLPWKELPLRSISSRCCGDRNLNSRGRVSTEETTPAGAWYDQETEEWVVLLQGAATIRFEKHAAPRTLKPGDFFNIPAPSRHLLEWTDLEQETIWLTLHYRPSEPSP